MSEAPSNKRSFAREQFEAGALALQYGLDLAIGLESEEFDDVLVSVTGTETRYYPRATLYAHVHAHAEVGIVTTGAMRHYFPRWQEEVAVGDIWMHGMWEPHGYHVLLPETTRVVVSFLPEYLHGETVGGRSWWSLFAAPPAVRPKVREENRARVLALARELEEEAKKAAPDWQVAARLLTLQLLHVLSRDWSPPAEVAEGPPEQVSCLGRLLPALALVKERGGKEVTLAEAAAACGLRRSQFSAEFHRALGVTFGQFRLRAKLAAAAHQFLTSDLTVGAVARRAGFADASHLSRAFQRHYGCTPGRYRARVVQNKR